MTPAEIFDLSGHTALITGAAKGLGAKLAEAMGEAGASVVCADIDENGAAQTADTIRAMMGTGRRALHVRCDVSDEGDVRSLFDMVDSTFGRLDILFNNAGISDTAMRQLHEYETAAWNHVLNVNLQSVFFCCRAALKIMVRQRRGKIIDIASMWGLSGGATLKPIPAYAAAKGAVVNLTRELGLEYAPYNINVNAICPGFFVTRLGDGAYDSDTFREAAVAHTPMGRLALADEIKGTALYLASSASDFMCGHPLVIDGGVTAA